MMQTDSPFFPTVRLSKLKASEVPLGENLGHGGCGASVISIGAEGTTNPSCSASDLDHTTTNKPLADTIHDDETKTEDSSFSRTTQIDKLSVQVQIMDGFYASTHVFRNGKPLYALKQLRDDLKGNKLDQARVALSTEATFLRSLRGHPNICMVQGTFGEPGTDGFSIVTDRLTMNLREKMGDWKKWDDRRFRLLKKVVLRRHQPSKWEQLQVQKTIYGEKLTAVYDVARALLHLAENRIIFRDLKPENVGVDAHGVMRLFNFGLAKELKDEDLTAPGMYKLTGMTGSRPYMAPEVFRSKDYGLSADVYSFAILIWEVMSNRNAYPFMTSEKLFELVVHRKKRPDLKKMIEKRKRVLPEGSYMHDLVRLCWCHESRDRPTIKQVCDLIRAEIELYRGGDDGSSSTLEE